MPGNVPQELNGKRELNMSIRCADFNTVHFPGRSLSGAAGGSLEGAARTETPKVLLAIASQPRKASDSALVPCHLLPSICSSSVRSELSFLPVKGELGKGQESTFLKSCGENRSHSPLLSLEPALLAGLSQHLPYVCCPEEE